MKKLFTLALVLTCSFCAHPAFAEKATAAIQGTAAGSPISGTATFEDSANGLLINVDITGAPPGEHGFHVHTGGSCANAGNAAGGHFNPDGTAHGYLPTNGFASAHAGDLGNIEVDSTGHGKLELMIPGLTVSQGKYAVADRALILHEKEDNFGQPTGNAGGRIACGVITVAKQ